MIPAQQIEIATEQIMVPAADPGILLHVRNKHPENISNYRADQIILFVHGATYCSEAGFDLPLDGLSWMDYLAHRGWDVYIMDVRGYGRSTRPPEMARPAAENPPIVNTYTAAGDVSAVVDYILARRMVQRINLLGWSWGTTIMGSYCAKNNEKVGRLVLYAPVWLFKNAQTGGGAARLGAYRKVTKEEAKKRMVSGVAIEKQKELLPDKWFDAWWEEAVRPDPVGTGQEPQVVRAPNGVVADLVEHWMAGKSLYDPANITVPTLLIVGEWDADAPPYMAQAIFANLKNTPKKRLVTIGEATHSVVMEKNRLQLFREVQLFLEEPN